MKYSADIVIVNWNSDGLLADCLQSIEKFGSSVGRVIVVDNGSTDNSAHVSFAGLDLKIINLEENQGFARACNVGAQETSSPYILFLNPDTRFLDGKSLPDLLTALETESAENIGIAGIRLVDDEGKTQRSCANFTNLSTFIGQPFGLDKLLPSVFTPLFADFDYMKSRDVDQAIGAYFVARRKMFLELGGFDERFFVYWEEVDLCLRAKQAGWRTRYYADSVAFHKGGGTSDRVKAKRLFYQLRSRILYSFKHFGSLRAWIILLITVAIEPLSRILRSLLHGSLPEARDTISGYMMLWAEIPAVLRIHRRLGR